MRILIVEDEEHIANGLKFNFEQEGYDAVAVGNGRDALDLFEQADPPFDLIVLDLMLPGMSGYEACQAIRAHDRFVPILVLSARTLSEDRSLAFDAGTDQYMTKPFALPELLSRVRNLLEKRRLLLQWQSERPAEREVTYEFDNVKVDFDKFTVTVDGKVHQLTTMEMQLLKYFIDNEGRVLSRSQILRDVWDETAIITTRTIDNFVLRLRKVIEPNPADPTHILSIRGTGYRFVGSSGDLTLDLADG
jgi:two-component system OmpR family response regulator